MVVSPFEAKVRSVDWAKYLGSVYYDPEKMYFDPDSTIRALIDLGRLDYDDDKESLSSDLRYAAGNDHRGTYYPAALDVIDLIIEIEKNSQFDAARKCAADVLTDLYYFRLEIGSSNEDLYKSIESDIRKKLQPYSDDEINS